MAAASCAIFGASGASAADETCASIASDAERLACYDRAAGRLADAPIIAAQPARIKAPQAEAKPANAPVFDDASTLSKAWELDPADKRGLFNPVPHKLNCLLPAYYTSSANRQPSSPAHRSAIRWRPDRNRDSRPRLPPVAQAFVAGRDPRA